MLYTALPLVLLFLALYFSYSLLVQTIATNATISAFSIISVIKKNGTNEAKNLLGVKTDAHLGGLHKEHPLRLTIEPIKVQNNVTIVNATTQRASLDNRKLMYSTDTGIPSQKINTGVSDTQALRYASVYTVNNVEKQKQLKKIVSENCEHPNAKSVKKILPENSPWWDQPIAIKPQLFNEYFEKFSSMESEKYIQKNPLVVSETLIWGAKYDPKTLPRIEQLYKFVATKETPITPQEMLEINKEINTILKHARTAYNLHPELIAKYQEIEYYCNLVKKFLSQ